MPDNEDNKGKMKTYSVTQDWVYLSETLSERRVKFILLEKGYFVVWRGIITAIPPKWEFKLIKAVSKFN